MATEKKPTEIETLAKACADTRKIYLDKTAELEKAREVVAEMQRANDEAWANYRTNVDALNRALSV